MYPQGGIDVAKAFRFEDHSDIVLKKLAGNAKQAVELTGKLLVEKAQEKMMYGYHDPHGADGHTEIVDTGKLFDSMDSRAEKTSQNAYEAVVGSDVPYLKFVHEGTRKLKGRPFITDAMMDNQDEIKQTMADALKQGF